MADVTAIVSNYLDDTKNLTTQERRDAGCRIVNDLKAEAKTETTKAYTKEVSDKKMLDFQLRDIQNKKKIELEKFKMSQKEKRYELQSAIEQLDLEVEQKSSEIDTKYMATSIHLETERELIDTRIETLKKSLGVNPLDCCKSDCSCK